MTQHLEARAPEARPPVTTSFAEVSAVTRTARDAFAADVHPEWTIGGKPNGGYLLAMLARAALATSSPDHPHVAAASAHYVRSPVPGPVDIETELLGAGRSASQVRARMIQEGRIRVESLLTTGRLGEGSEPFWQAGAPDPEMSTQAADDRVAGISPEGLRVAVMDQVHLQLDRATSGFRTGRPSGRGELRGWLSLPGGEPFDPVSLLFAVDALPPATFDIAQAGWVPTLELTAYLRALPVPGPVRVLQRAQVVHAQRVDEACFVWDRTGRLVAQATQLAAIRLG